METLILSLKKRHWGYDETKPESQRENNYLEWLDRVENSMSDEERDLVLILPPSQL